jgi:hypothetical protein
MTKPVIYPKAQKYQNDLNSVLYSISLPLSLRDSSQFTISPRKKEREGLVAMIRNARALALIRFSISRSASKHAALQRPLSALSALSAHAHHLFDESHPMQNRSWSTADLIQGRVFSSNGGGPFEYSKEVSLMLPFSSFSFGV